jgi:2,4-dienoyl-CoA reductase-like NADH-dependent reductase (Old Yellow Enzyme family)
MSVLFEPQHIGNFDIRNRFIRSATYFALSDQDGCVSDEGIDVMKTLAENDIGLIVTGYAFINKNGQVYPDMNGIQDDEKIPGYQKMTRAVHERNGRIVMQIAHGGVTAHTVALTGGDYMAVSVTDDLPDYGVKPREMTDEDIEKLIVDFGQAARRVQEAGFDGVQIHGAHGYLIAQFHSPWRNQRQDKWGGSIENRMRFVVEVTREIKKQVDDDFPVMIKLGCRDFLEGKSEMTVEDGVAIAEVLEKEGICLFEMSNNIGDDAHRKKILNGITAPEKEAVYLPQARVIRKAISAPLGLVAGMRSLPVMEEIVQSGAADLMSLCRPFIREPDLLKRWKSGDTRSSDCISCYQCNSADDHGKSHVFCSQLARAEAKEKK